MKSIAFIGSAGIPAKYGGFETVVEQLALRLCQTNNCIVYCEKRKYKNKKDFSHENIRRVFIPLKANGISSILYDICSVLHALKIADILLIFGISAGPFITFINKLTQQKIIINVDGLESRRDKWNILASWYLTIAEKTIIRNCPFIISDNPGIQAHIKNQYNKESIYIPYGADHLHENTEERILQKNKLIKQNYDYVMARIEKENNIEMICRCYANLPHRVIIIQGNWKNTSYGKKLYKKYSLKSHMILIGSIYRPAVVHALRKNARIYIHGHSKGGTNPSLIEAMYSGIPVFAYDCIFNRYTTANKALYFSNDNELTKLLLHTSKNILDNMAIQLKEVAKRIYRWDKIVKEYEKLIYTDEPHFY